MFRIEGARKVLLITSLIALVSFVLNFIWEVMQMPFYVCDLTWIDCLKACAVAGLGDVVMIVGIFIIVTFIFSKENQFIKITGRDYLLMALLGFLFAIIFEQFAEITNRWQYTELMPIFPILKIGMVPLIQLTLLTPVSVYISLKLIQKINN